MRRLSSSLVLIVALSLQSITWAQPSGKLQIHFMDVMRIIWDAPKRYWGNFPSNIFPLTGVEVITAIPMMRTWPPWAPSAKRPPKARSSPSLRVGSTGGHPHRRAERERRNNGQRE